MNSPEEKIYRNLIYFQNNPRIAGKIMFVNQMIQLKSTWLQTEQSALVNVVMLLSGLENEWT